MNEFRHNFSLGELSLADAIKIIKVDESLDPRKRSQWLCSMRSLAKWIGRRPEFLPARMTALRHPVARLNAARLGISPKTLSNAKSNLRAALGHLSGQDLTVSRGASLSAELDIIFKRIADPWARKRLHSLFRYLSACGLRPDEVDATVLDDFFRHRTETTFLTVTAGRRREVARAWNSCVENVPGFPDRRLPVEAIKPRWQGPAWQAFPVSFRGDVESYLDRLKVLHHSASGRRRRACKPSTIATRRRELIAAARMAVACGVPIENLTGLRDLVTPDTAEKVLDAYWQQNGERPKNYVIDLAWKLASVARETNCLSDAELNKLDDMRYALEQYRHTGLTDKNLAVVRAVIAGDIWARVVQLPDKLMADAQRLRSRSPVKAAVLAELAVAIRILTYAPVRIGNLANVKLDENLIRPAGINSPYWLTFPGYDVKNGVDLTFVFDEQVSAFIDRFIRDFRPVLLRGSNQPWLFPGGRGERRPKRPSTLSDQISRFIEKELGIRVTAHQFRHAAAALILKEHPGNFELVRRILGHRNLQTTVRFYTGLETAESSKQFSELIRQQEQRQ